jgi:hypothetical protein
MTHPGHAGNFRNFFKDSTFNTVGSFYVVL